MNGSKPRTIRFELEDASGDGPVPVDRAERSVWSDNFGANHRTAYAFGIRVGGDPEIRFGNRDSASGEGAGHYWRFADPDGF